MIERVKALKEIVKSAKNPLIEMIGNRRALIENHCGVVEYSDEQITVKTHCGSVSFVGAHLQLALISNERIIITGRISEAKIRGGGEEL